MKLTLLQRCRQNMQKKINRLKDKLQVTADDRGMLLDDVDHDDFKKLVLSESPKIHILGANEGSSMQRCLPRVLVPSHDKMVSLPKEQIIYYVRGIERVWVHFSYISKNT